VITGMMNQKTGLTEERIKLYVYNQFLFEKEASTKSAQEYVKLHIYQVVNSFVNMEFSKLDNLE
jgi:hypothetical protein